MALRFDPSQMPILHPEQYQRPSWDEAVNRPIQMGLQGLVQVQEQDRLRQQQELASRVQRLQIGDEYGTQGIQDVYNTPAAPQKKSWRSIFQGQQELTQQVQPLPVAQPGQPGFDENAYRARYGSKRLKMFQDNQDRTIGNQFKQSEINKNEAAAFKDRQPPQATPYQSFQMSEKQDQFNQKEWDRIVKDTDPLQASARTGLGMAARADYNANRAMVTLSKPMVTNQEAANVMADIAQIYQGGSPTEYGMSHQGYNTLQSKIMGSLQYLTGKPQDALSPDIQKRLLSVLQEMKQTNSAVFKQQLDHIERAQPKLIGSHQDEWRAIRANVEGGIRGGPDNGGTQGGQGGLPGVGETFNGAKVLRVRQVK